MPKKNDYLFRCHSRNRGDYRKNWERRTRPGPFSCKR